MMSRSLFAAVLMATCTFVVRADAVGCGGVSLGGRVGEKAGGRKGSACRMIFWGPPAYALVCNTHPEPRKGTVRIAGDWKSARTMFGEGVTFVDGALAFDMPPLGVAIVKLENDAK